MYAKTTKFSTVNNLILGITGTMGTNGLRRLNSELGIANWEFILVSQIIMRA